MGWDRGTSNTYSTLQEKQEIYWYLEQKLSNKARSIYRDGQKTKKTDAECFRLQGLGFFMPLQYNMVEVIEGKII